MLVEHVVLSKYGALQCIIWLPYAYGILSFLDYQ